MTRAFVRVSLAAAIVVALSVAIVSVRQLGAANPTTWATVAAVLAVLAAATSAWTSQRVVELQEDALEPNPVPSIDVRSRYDLAQLRLTNRGGPTAYDIRLTWEQPLHDDAGREVVLGPGGAIPVLGPAESASASLGTAHDFLAKASDTTRSGQVTFANASGRRRSKPFVVSAEHERRALMHDQEAPRTHFELQRIPDALKRIADEIERLGRPQAPGPKP